MQRTQEQHAKIQNKNSKEIAQDKVGSNADGLKKIKNKLISKFKKEWEVI